MKEASPFERVLVISLGAVLLASAVASVELHLRTRGVFTAHEREVAMTRRLSDDRAELLMKVHRASLPGSIASGAQELGLKGATGANTVTIVEKDDGSMVWSAETLARLATIDEAAAKAKEQQAKSKGQSRRGGAS